MQVWFQNQRAKIKKLNKKDSDSGDTFKHGPGSEGRSTEDIRSSDDEEESVISKLKRIGIDIGELWLYKLKSVFQKVRKFVP